MFPTVITALIFLLFARVLYKLGAFGIKVSMLNCFYSIYATVCCKNKKPFYSTYAEIIDDESSKEFSEGFLSTFANKTENLIMVTDSEISI